MKSTLTILTMLIAATSAAPIATHPTDAASFAMDPAAATADEQAQILRRCHRGHSHGGMEVPLECPNGVDDDDDDDDVAEDEQEMHVKRNHNEVIGVEGVDSVETPDEVTIAKRVAVPSHEGEDDEGVH